MPLTSSPIGFTKQLRNLAKADHFANAFSGIAANG
jgi:hypothetical protein